MLVHVTLTLVSRTPLKDQQLRPVPTGQRPWRDDKTFVVTQGTLTSLGITEKYRA